MMKTSKNLLIMLAVLLISQMAFAPAIMADKTPSGKQTTAVRSAREGNIYRLKKQSFVDRQGIGMEAFSILVPAGWQSRGGIDWILDNPQMPAVARLNVKNAASGEELEVFPNQAMFWTNNQMLLASFPIGSKYFGAEVRPVAEPLDALTKVVLPRFRGNASGFKIVSKKRLPDLARSLGAGSQQPGVKSFADAAKIRIEYTKAGTVMEEEIFAVVEGFTFSMQTMQGVISNTSWYVDYIFSFKAPKGRLDAGSGLYRAMIGSFRVNPQWFNKYSQLVNQLIQGQIQHINSIGEVSRIVSRTSNEISDSMMKSYREREKVYDRIGENFSEYVRGTEHYNNPIEGREVELPSGYSHVWANPGGEYILSDNPNYNPNVGSTTRWEELKKK